MQGKWNGMGERNLNEVSMREDENLNGAGLPSAYRSMNDPTKEVEDSILSNLEAQPRRTKPIADGFRSPVPGERAPLGIESVGTALTVTASIVLY
jgi:hypothetical protein